MASGDLIIMCIFIFAFLGIFLLEKMTFSRLISQEIILAYNQGKKFRKFRSKFRFSVEIDKISPPKFQFPNFFRHFPIFSDISPKFLFFPCFFLLFFNSKNLKKVLYFWRVSNPSKMPGSSTLQPPSHSLHLLYI